MSRLERWPPVLLTMALIFFGSSCSISPKLQGVINFHGDKVVHIVEYGLLGYWLCRAIAGETIGRSTRALMIWTLFLGIAYGATDELHQRFVPTRNSNAVDLLADGVGVALGACVWLLIRRKQNA